jgi:hypothetical protein
MKPILIVGSRAEQDHTPRLWAIHRITREAVPQMDRPTVYFAELRDTSAPGVLAVLKLSFQPGGERGASKALLRSVTVDPATGTPKMMSAAQVVLEVRQQEPLRKAARLRKDAVALFMNTHAQTEKEWADVNKAIASMNAEAKAIEGRLGIKSEVPF